MSERIPTTAEEAYALTRDPRALLVRGGEVAAWYGNWLARRRAKAAALAAKDAPEVAPEPAPAGPPAGKGGVVEVAASRLAVPAAPEWVERDGVVYFTLPPTDGTTGEGWISRLERAGYRPAGDCAKSALRSSGFRPTSGVAYGVAVLKGELFGDDDRCTRNVRAEASRRGFTTPNAEIACLIREQFSDGELAAMGLWYIVAMH